MYTYKLKIGVSTVNYYGLAIAGISCIPFFVIRTAKLIATAMHLKQLVGH